MKSWFLYPAAAASGVLTLAALVAAGIVADERQAWLGAALACAPLPLFIARIRLARVARTSENLPLLLLASAAGLILAAWEAVMERQAGWPPVAVSLAGTLALLLYVFGYSRFGRFPSPALAVGGKLPAFELADLEGAAVRSGDFRGTPAIFLFFSGNDCPFCVAQVLEIAERSEELESLGVRLALISPQAAERSRRLSRDAARSGPFHVDRGNAAAGVLGIAEGGAVLPTVVVTNANGTILYSDQTDNYRVRPEPDVYISILKRAGAINRSALP